MEKEQCRGKGWLVLCEHLSEGIEAFPRALAGSFAGENIGNLVIQV